MALTQIANYTSFSGEDVRELINEVGIDRFGFDGTSAYIFLKDDTTIEIKALGDNLLSFTSRTPTNSIKEN